MIKRHQVELPRPRLALLGRPNVGKSTLFNRLLGTRKAVVSSVAGTTRDRLYGQVEWRGITLTLIDSGGMELVKREGLAEAVQQQIDHVLAEADGFLFVCDAKTGWLPADQMIVERLRRIGKTIILVLNKADHQPIVPPEFFSLGLDRPLTVSALHGHGTGELLDRLVNEFATPGEASSADLAMSGRRRRRVVAEPPTAAPQLPSIAIVGRQNVGKSSLLNAFLEEERVIVSEQPGTTRDAIDIVMQVEGQPVVLLDTAGLRHRRKVAHAVDFFSMSRTRRVLGRCSLALALLDGAEPVTRDDRRIIAEICREGCGLMLLVNKWDLVKGGKERTLELTVRRLLSFASFAPVLAVSAKTGFHVPHVLSTALRIMRTMKEGLSETACTSMVQAAWGSQHPPRSRGRPLRFHQARWLSGRPPRIELTISPAMRLPEPFEHYLSNRLHADPRLVGIPVGFVVKGLTDNRRPVPATIP